MSGSQSIMADSEVSREGMAAAMELDTILQHGYLQV